MLKYKKLSKYLRSISQGGAPIKSVVYSKDFPFNVSSSFSLFSTCVNNMASFGEFKEKVQRSSETQISDKYLFFVMLAEFINTGKIVGGGKIKKLIVSNAEKLDIPIKSKIIKSNVQLRVRNNLRLREIQEFKKDPHIQGLYDLSYDEYSEFAKSHAEVFEGNKIVIQSKSSCLPPWLLFQNLNINAKFDIIDCCSAPGNKTIQLSQYIKDYGSILAFEKDQKRFSLLNSRLQKFQIQNAKTYNEDFLLTRPNDPRFKGVKMILADPSCSGSGMLVNFQNNILDQQVDFQGMCRQMYSNLSSKEKLRVESLKQFQLSILNHCAKLKPLRLSYSTCSIYQQENEEVVKEFLQLHPEYRIKRRPKSIDDLPRGFGELGNHCVRMNPMDRATDGFFVCVFKLK